MKEPYSKNYRNPHYDEDLKKHRVAYKKAYVLLLPLLNGKVFKFSSDAVEKLNKDAFAHDASKTDIFEYTACANYFYGKRTAEVEKQYSEAVQKHKRLNPHHPEFPKWQTKDGKIKMPNGYLFEMLCDWGANTLEKMQDIKDCSKTEQEIWACLCGIKQYYEDNKSTWNFCRKNREKIEQSIELIVEKFGNTRLKQNDNEEKI